jgi:hypothetical protein
MSSPIFLKFLECPWNAAATPHYKINKNKGTFDASQLPVPKLVIEKRNSCQRNIPDQEQTPFWRGLKPPPQKPRPKALWLLGIDFPDY